ncbi:MAG: hypothetical protein EXS46_03335 [Candidatus Taylorbacteria bacterium]|nr:hypothetical protein [Candidatus Taylorbacteria bacterium]
MDTKPLALVICGGTINEVPDATTGKLGMAKKAEDFLNFVPEIGEMGDFDTLVFENIDSSQSDPMVWTRLAIFLKDILKKYSGIVVTHGTDTMAESATAISLVFAKKLRIPIVFTGAQLPMVDHLTDGKRNLIGAFIVAKKAALEGVTEVMIYFDHQVFRANRTWKKSEKDFNTFSSGSFPLLAYVNASPAWKNNSEHWNKAVFHPASIRNVGDAQGEFGLQFGEGVFVTDLYPGTPPEFLTAGIKSGCCKGLILKAMGAGNIPYLNPRYDLRPVIKMAVSMSIPVLITLKFPDGMASSSAIYEAGQVALDAGAIPTGDMVHEAAYVKLLYAMGLGFRSPNEAKILMHTPMAGEITV